MPRDHGFRFDDHQRRSPAAPHFGKPDPQKPIGDTQTEPMISVGSSKYQELMSEGKDLGPEGDLSLKALPNRRKQRENGR
jgi:hypothetical protein